MIILKVKELKNWREKLIGLMGKVKPQAVLIKTRFGIHTFFMKSPIDILILDKNNRVVYLKENLRSNRIYFWNPLYKIILELPVGTIKNKKLTVNKKINLTLLP